MENLSNQNTQSNIIKIENEIPLKSLCKSSTKKVFIKCDNCENEFWIRFITYNKSNHHLCIQCRGKENAKKGSLKISKSLKKSWSSGYRKKPQKEKYYLLLKKSMELENYKIITSLDEYIIGDEFIKYICPNNHKGKVSYKQWTYKKRRCNKCKNEKREERIKKLSEENEFEILNLDNKYIEYKCLNGHINKTLLSNYYKGIGCPYCDFEGRSTIPEIEIKDYLKSIGISNIISNSREIINPYELDIYLPDYNFAIEFDGFPYHTEMYNKNTNIHLSKTILCEKKKIKLIHIFYNEWEYKRDIVKSRLCHILNKNNKKRIYARKCIIKEINVKEYKNFCELYHLQGYSQSKIKLGMFYENELISIMSFGKQSIAKGNKTQNINEYELIRFCSKYNVIGAAGKLLSYFKNNYNWNKIITFADRRWSNGDLYYKLGFKFDHYTPKNYWYINLKSKNKVLEYRFKYRKDQIKHLGIGTEWEIMQSNNYTRIWDCGNMKFSMIFKTTS